MSWNKIEIAIINVDIFLKTKICFKNLKKKFFIYYLAGYPVSGQAGYPVSGKIIGRISGQISIRYNPTFKTLTEVSLKTP